MSTHHQDPGHDLHSNGPGYETTDASVPAIVKSGVAVFGTMAFAFVAMFALYWLFQQLPQAGEAQATEQQRQRVIPNAPLLQVDQTADLRETRERDSALVNSYARDARSGQVRLPVDRAMELILERGLPAVKPQPVSAPPASQ